MSKRTQAPTAVAHVVLTPCRLRPLSRSRHRPRVVVPSYDQLSALLRNGRQFHPLAKGRFVGQHVTGYYHYERKETLTTCALAAAYVGAFGPDSIDLLFSHSMACFQLEAKLGYRVDGREVANPANGRTQSVSMSMQCLVDDHWWNRRGVADWLERIGL